MSSLLSGTQERRKQIYDKVRAKTGLDSHPQFLIWYKALMDSADYNDGIVMYGELKYEMQEFMLICAGMTPTSEHWGTFTEEIDDVYEMAMQVFKEKGLIDYYTTSTGAVYPRLIGYNYMNDPEFYIAAKLKKDERWNARISTPLSVDDVVRHLKRGYEFREKDIVNAFFN